MNTFRVGLIETLHHLGAACARQAAREASPLLACLLEQVHICRLPAAPLPPLLFAGAGNGPANCRKDESGEKGGAKNAENIWRNRN